MAQQRTRLSRVLTMTPEDQGVPRMRAERNKLKRSFPGFGFVGRDGAVVALVGEISTPLGNTYKVRINLPDGYPYGMPAVETVGWRPSPRAPHQYSATSLCVMHPRFWSSKYTLAYIVAKTALWLAKYEVWRVHKRWPGRNQHGDEYERPGDGVSDETSGLWAAITRAFD